MNTGIAFARKMSAAYTAVCKPLCQSLHLPQTAFDILMFLGNNPEYSTARDIVEVRQIKANLVSVHVDRLVTVISAVKRLPATAGRHSSYVRKKLPLS